jgi:molybdopterin-guanine dinucleotide biosynthesis protein MobB
MTDLLHAPWLATGKQISRGFQGGVPPWSQGEAGSLDGIEATVGRGKAKLFPLRVDSRGSHYMTPIVSIVGTSNSGKTTLLEKLIPELKSRGYRVALVKHDVHGFEMDHEGKDSWRLKRAGADAVIISSPWKIALVQEVDRDSSLEQLRNRFQLDVDVILAEGFKRGAHPKIEVFRQGHRDELLCAGDDNLLAVASDVPLAVGVPCLDINDPKPLVDLIEKKIMGKRTKT